jgi:hypothetical protein
MIVALLIDVDFGVDPAAERGREAAHRRLTWRMATITKNRESRMGFEFLMKFSETDELYEPLKHPIPQPW